MDAAHDPGRVGRATRSTIRWRRRSSLIGTELYISASMGISLFPQDAEDVGRSAAQR